MPRPPPTSKPPRGQSGLSGLLTASSKLLRNAIPVPGVDELSTMAKLLLLKIQSSPEAPSELRALGQKLQRVSVILKELTLLDLENAEHYQSQLNDIEHSIDRALGSSGRISRFRRAKDTLDVYEDLDRRLSSIIEVAQLEVQGRMALSQEEDKLAETIHPQEITDLSDPLDWRGPHRSEHLPDGTRTSSDNSLVTCTRRRGKLGTVCVHYITYTSSSSAQARKTMREFLAKMAQVSHNHIAAVLAKTSGCSINGIVLTAGNTPVKNYLAQGGLREAAKCILDYNGKPLPLEASSAHSVIEREPLYQLDITEVEIRDNGSTLVIPRMLDEGGINMRPIPDRIGDSNGCMDPALQLFMPYFNDLPFGGVIHLRELDKAFIHSLATGRMYWNEIRALMLARESGLPPPIKCCASWSSNTPWPFKIQLFDMLRVNKSEEGRTTLRRINNTCSYFAENLKELGSQWVFSNSPRRVQQSRDDGWISIACDPDRETSFCFGNNPPPEGWSKIWPSFVSTIKSHVHSKFPLHEIYLCTGIRLCTKVEALGLNETENLYFHFRKSPAAHPADIWGHFSTSSSVIPGVTQQEAKRRGWKVTYKMRVLFCHTQGEIVKDDWGYLYESALQNAIDMTPGTFEPEGVCTDPAEGLGSSEEPRDVNLVETDTSMEVEWHSWLSRDKPT